jgi:hypothetical protein
MPAIYMTIQRLNYIPHKQIISVLFFTFTASDSY